jgi:hypothetical protein
MVRLILLWLLFLSPNFVQAKHPYESEQAILNRVAIDTDTIFTGRVLRKKEFDNGLVYADGNTWSIGILEVEILKVYRGNIRKNNTQLLCTWFLGGERPFGFSIDQELIFFGLKIDNNRVLIPDTYGYIRGVEEKESAIYKALKLKKKIKHKSNPFSEVFSDSEIVKNPCSESIDWSK